MYNYFKDASQEFRLKNIDKARNYLLEETKQNKLMSKKHKKVCTILNYIEYPLILASPIMGVFQCMLLLLFLVTLWELWVLQ